MSGLTIHCQVMDAIMDSDELLRWIARACDGENDDADVALIQARRWLDRAARRLRGEAISGEPGCEVCVCGQVADVRILEARVRERDRAMLALQRVLEVETQCRRDDHDAAIQPTYNDGGCRGANVCDQCPVCCGCAEGS